MAYIPSKKLFLSLALLMCGAPVCASGAVATLNTSQVPAPLASILGYMQSFMPASFTQPLQVAVDGVASGHSVDQAAAEQAALQAACDHVLGDLRFMREVYPLVDDGREIQPRVVAPLVGLLGVRQLQPGQGAHQARAHQLPGKHVGNRNGRLPQHAARQRVNAQSGQHYVGRLNHR